MIARLPQIEYRTPAPADGPSLAAMARRCFGETFGQRYEKRDLETFLDAAYGPDGMLAELEDSQVDFRIALDGAEIIAYAKVSPLKAPASDPKPGALELRQIYVSSPWQGTGVAESLMRWALDRARTRRAPEIYLTVFDDNHRAKSFYARHAFVDVGGCLFRCGSNSEDDRIWRRLLAA